MIGPTTGLDSGLVRLLSAIEIRTGSTLVITSAHRPDPSSSHSLGLAVDLSAPSSRTRYGIVRAALLEGINRIGVYDSHVHLDIDPQRPAQVLWVGTST